MSGKGGCEKVEEGQVALGFGEEREEEGGVD